MHLLSLNKILSGACRRISYLKSIKLKISISYLPSQKIIMKLIFIEGNQQAQQFIPLMGYAILHALWESIEKNSLNKYCNAYNNLSQKCRDYLHIQSANRKP